MTVKANENAVVQLSRSGPVLSGSEDDLAGLRETFARQHWLLLPNFLQPALLETLMASLARTEFVEVESDLDLELQPADPTVYYALELLLNSPKTLALVPRLTGRGPAVSFVGRVYRKLPGPEHFNRWHSDVSKGGRMVALSINLSAEPFAGGELEMREAATRRPVCKLHNVGPGDAILFPIDPALEHRVMTVTGATPKTALAGWFYSRHIPESLFGRGRP